MKNEKLNMIQNSLEEITTEAKTAFVKQFPYLDITEKAVDANQIVWSVPETTGDILVSLSCYLTVPFSTFKKIMNHKYILPFNFEIKNTYNNRYTDTVTVLLNRFYYHTKKKIIFSM